MKVAIVTNEPVWPVRSGGTARIAGIAGALHSAGMEVTVYEPNARAEDQAEIRRAPIHAERAHPVREFASTMPRLAFTSLGRRPAEALRTLAAAEVTITSHSYLAAALPAHWPGRVIVDFQNIEADRQAAFAAARVTLARGLLAKVEAAKAARWEPRVAARADLCLAVNLDDAARLAAWNASVAVVPNAIDRPPGDALGRSPADGPVLLLANATYEPNAHAIRWIVDEVWPRVRAAHDTARLIIAGRATKEVARSSPRAAVEVVGEVDDVSSCYRSAATALAPVRSGGGTQLKVLEALAHGRTLVSTAFSAASIPAKLVPHVTVADDASGFADGIIRHLRNIESRHGAERRIIRDACAIPSWHDAASPLVAELRRWASA